MCLAYYGAIWVYSFDASHCHEAYRIGKIGLQYLIKNEQETELTAT